MDVTLRVAEAESVPELGRAVEDAVSHVIPSLEWVKCTLSDSDATALSRAPSNGSAGSASLKRPRPKTNQWQIPIVIGGSHAIGYIKGSSGGVPSDEEWCGMLRLSKLASRCFSFLCHAPSPADAYQVKTHDRRAGILRLCADLHDQEPAKLQLKVVKYLEEEVGAETGFLLLVSPDENQLCCQVHGAYVLKEETRFSATEGLWQKLLQHRQPVFATTLNEPELSDVTSLLGGEVRSLLCVPVIAQHSLKPVAVACLANKHSSDGFSKADAEVVEECLQHTSPVLTSALTAQEERRLRNQTQALLNVAKKIFTHLDDLSSLLHEIMLQAKILTKAERCSLFLMDRETNELVAKVFDTEKENADIRIPANRGIAGHVAMTGDLLNIKDAYSHPLFYKEMDSNTGFRTRNILCFPIQDENGVITGVAELCNKVNGSHFAAADEEIAHSFSVYCAIAIAHCLMYQRVEQAMTRNKLSNELMMYHMQVNSEEETRLATAAIPAVTDFSRDFTLFTFTPRSIPDQESPMACVAMFEDLGLLSRWKISRATLARFLLMVKKGYRDPPYHNWSHAFSVAHFCHLICHNCHLHDYLEDIEILALMVACLCHDMDHRGTNNSFQEASQSVLAALYSSEGSVMERHHVAQTMCILNTEGCNIFGRLKSEDYRRVLDLVRDIILATDLAHHLRILTDLKHLVSGGYRREEAKSRNLLLCLLMTSADLSDQTKDWKSSKAIAAKLYEEFFSQGDLERALGRNPQAMMDRQRANIPELQIGFIDGIALPLYELLAQQFGAAEAVREQVKHNKKMWLRLQSLLKKQGSFCSIESFQEADIVLDEEDDRNGD